MKGNLLPHPPTRPRPQSPALLRSGCSSCQSESPVKVHSVSCGEVLSSLPSARRPPQQQRRNNADSAFLTSWREATQMQTAEVRTNSGCRRLWRQFEQPLCHLLHADASLRPDATAATRCSVAETGRADVGGKGRTGTDGDGANRTNTVRFWTHCSHPEGTLGNRYGCEVLNPPGPTY